MAVDAASSSGAAALLAFANCRASDSQFPLLAHKPRMYMMMYDFVARRGISSTIIRP